MCKINLHNIICSVGGRNKILRRERKAGEPYQGIDGDIQDQAGGAVGCEAHLLPQTAKICLYMRSDSHRVTVLQQRPQILKGWKYLHGRRERGLRWEKGKGVGCRPVPLGEAVKEEMFLYAHQSPLTGGDQLGQKGLQSLRENAAAS